MAGQVIGIQDAETALLGLEPRPVIALDNDDGRRVGIGDDFLDDARDLAIGKRHLHGVALGKFAGGIFIVFVQERNRVSARAVLGKDKGRMRQEDVCEDEFRPVPFCQRGERVQREARALAETVEGNRLHVQQPLVLGGAKGGRLQRERLELGQPAAQGIGREVQVGAVQFRPRKARREGDCLVALLFGVSHRRVVADQIPQRRARLAFGMDARVEVARQVRHIQRRRQREFRPHVIAHAALGHVETHRLQPQEKLRVVIPVRGLQRVGARVHIQDDIVDVGLRPLDLRDRRRRHTRRILDFELVPGDLPQREDDQRQRGDIQRRGPRFNPDFGAGRDEQGRRGQQETHAPDEIRPRVFGDVFLQPNIRVTVGREQCDPHRARERGAAPVTRQQAQQPEQNARAQNRNRHRTRSRLGTRVANVVRQQSQHGIRRKQKGIPGKFSILHSSFKFLVGNSMVWRL